MTASISSLLAVLVVCTLLQYVNADCPNWCNNRGYCTSPIDGDQHCVCDPGFTTEDCSQRICPKAYDPIQKQTMMARRTVRLSTGLLSGEMNGRFSFSFSGSSISLDANANRLSSDVCTGQFTQLRSASDVNCEREEYDEATGTGEYLITINEYPIMPHENNVFFHSGNPPISAFKCNMTDAHGLGAVGPFCSITDEVTSGIPEYKECGGHGQCDRIEGTSSTQKNMCIQVPNILSSLVSCQYQQRAPALH